MPRDGSGVYSAPAGTLATPNTPIESARHNALVNDLVQDANTARPVSAGGTGSGSAQGAIDSLFGAARTIGDERLLVVDPSDPSKRLRLDAGAVTPGQTRLLTAPDYDGTISTVAGAETLANKTLAEPVLDTAVSGTAVADQAAMEAGSSIALIVTPGRQHFHPSAAKVWAHFGVTGNLYRGYGVSSITDDGVGDATVNQSVALSSATGSIHVSVYTPSSLTIAVVHSYSVAAVRFRSYNPGGGQVDPTEWFATRFGDF